MKRIIFSKILTLGLIIAASNNMTLAFNPEVFENAENAFKKSSKNISCSEEIARLKSEMAVTESNLEAANHILEVIKQHGSVVINALNTILEGVKKGSEYVALKSAEKQLKQIKSLSLGKPNYAQISIAQSKVHAARNRYMAALKTAQARLDEAKREHENKLNDAKRKVDKLKQKIDEIRNSLEKAKKECAK